MIKLILVPCVNIFARATGSYLTSCHNPLSLTRVTHATFQWHQMQYRRSRAYYSEGSYCRAKNCFGWLKKVWHNSDNLPALSRAYTGHHQILCAGLECDGDSYYLSERKGISFGVRKTYMTAADGEGVMLVPEHVAITLILANRITG